MKKLLFFIFLNILFTASFGQIISDSAYSESEIILKTVTGDIHGILTISNKSPRSPLAIIIPGSGPTDRDCNSPLGIQTNAYKMLSEGLAIKGTSTVRFDKRGIGKSKAAMTSESDVKFETYIDDVKEWISLFRSDKRFSGIFVIGHSEGSLIGMVAANTNGFQDLFQ